MQVPPSIGSPDISTLTVDGLNIALNFKGAFCIYLSKRYSRLVWFCLSENATDDASKLAWRL